MPRRSSDPIPRNLFQAHFPPQNPFFFNEYLFYPSGLISLPMTFIPPVSPSPAIQTSPVLLSISLLFTWLLIMTGRNHLPNTFVIPAFYLLNPQSPEGGGRKIAPLKKKKNFGLCRGEQLRIVSNFPFVGQGA